MSSFDEDAGIERDTTAAEGPPGHESAAEVFAAYLADREGGEAQYFGALVDAHPALGSELLRMHELWTRVEPHVGRLAGDRPVLPSSAGTPPPRERYEIEGELGRGGMGVVLRVRDGALRRELALKVVKPEPGPLGERRRRRFLREARITARLAHPGILPVHEIHVDDTGRAAYSMPVVGGATLEEIYERVAEGDAEWSRERALGVLQRVCEALAHAHGRGIVHRDLKPANVMVGAYGETYVVDWGLARAAEDGDSHDGAFLDWAPPADDAPGLTVHGDVVGTPAYMAPEQAEGRTEDIGPASDTYAVGAMLYELLAGRPPYRGGSAREIVERVRVEAPPPLDRLSPPPPAELVAICERAMAREPERRYASVADLAADLRAHLEGRVVQAYATGGWAELTKWVTRNRGLAAAIATVVLLVVVGLVVILDLQRRRAEEILLGADGYRVAGYAQESELIWPAVPDNIPAMEAWLGRARAVVDRRDAHRARLAGAAPDEAARTEALLAELEGWTAPDGLIAEVEAGVRFASTLVPRTLEGLPDQGALTWDEVRLDVRADERFGGLDLAPQLGLVPLGPDPLTGLQEFGHLASGEPARRGADGQLRTDESTGIVLTLLPGGSFSIGARPPSDQHPLGAPNVREGAMPSEGPVHAIALDPFFIGKFEVTRAQWRRTFGATPRLDWHRSPDFQLPVCGVSWSEATRFVERLDLRLPTEAQWEYAARGGTTTTWWGAGGPLAIEAAEWFGPDGPAPIGSRRPNPFGLFDAMGNNLEWAAEPFGSYDEPVARGDGRRLGDPDTAYRVLRGASWGFRPSQAPVSQRFVQGSDAALAASGLRVARAVRDDGP